MNGRLGIITLGELGIQVGGENVSGFYSRKVEALLVYLAIERQLTPQERQQFGLPPKP